MNIEQVKKIAKLTKSKKSIELLLDEEEELTQSIITTVDRINKADVIYDEEGINTFIELIKNNIRKYTEFDKDICIILKAITDKYHTNQEININDINSMIKLYTSENYSITTVSIIKQFKPILPLEDFNKLYEALKSIKFELDLQEFSIENDEVKEFIPTRTIDEVCSSIKEDNGLTINQIYDTYFDEDVLKYRTFEESKKIGNKIMEAYKSEEYNKKIAKDKHNEKDDIDLIATDKMLITRMNNDEHLSIMDEFINEPSYELYKIITNRDLLEHRTYHELIKLIKLYKENNDTYEAIVNHKLLLLPIDIQIEYINIVTNTKSPYIKDIILNSDKPITIEYLEKLKELNKPVEVKDELYSSSIDEFIKSLEDNGIEKFNSETQIYVKKK